MISVKETLDFAQQTTEFMLQHCDRDNTLLRAQLMVMRWNINRMIDADNARRKLVARIRGRGKQRGWYDVLTIMATVYGIVYILPDAGGVKKTGAGKI